jgi:hypothetical protein
VPSAIVQASANFGAFSNDILIANTGDGLINAFDPSTGQFLGALKDGNGNPIANPQLHSMFFGNGTAGNADTLYLTAAPAGDASGIFAAITVNSSGMGPDFILTSDRQSITVAPGQIGDFSVTATPAGNFRSAFTFTCIAPAGATCIVSSPSFDPATGAAVVAVTATASRPAGSNVAMAVLLPGVLLMGIGWRGRRRLLSSFGFFAIVLFGLSVAGMTGCGSYGGGTMVTPPTAQNFSVTANAGSISHTTVLTLNVQ